MRLSAAVRADPTMKIQAKRWRGKRRDSRSSGRRRVIEQLEPRLVLTWGAIPPASIVVPHTSTSVTSVVLVNNDATRTAQITSNEVDYYSFTATATGNYLLSATTPSSDLDPVLGLYSATGQRLAYNDDIAPGANPDSRLAVSLRA